MKERKKIQNLEVINFFLGVKILFKCLCLFMSFGLAVELLSNGFSTRSLNVIS